MRRLILGVAAAACALVLTVGASGPATAYWTAQASTSVQVTAPTYPVLSQATYPFIPPQTDAHGSTTIAYGFTNLGSLDLGRVSAAVSWFAPPPPANASVSIGTAATETGCQSANTSPVQPAIPQSITWVGGAVTGSTVWLCVSVSWTDVLTPGSMSVTITPQATTNADGSGWQASTLPVFTMLMWVPDGAARSAGSQSSTCTPHIDPQFGSPAAGDPASGPDDLLSPQPIPPAGAPSTQPGAEPTIEPESVVAPTPVTGCPEAE